MVKFRIKHKDQIVDTTGMFSLDEMISFISSADALVACSTGMLHLAGATGINAIGLYPPLKAMSPTRWAPIGLKATYIVKEKRCSDCIKNGICLCMTSITPNEVYAKLMKITK